MIVKKTQGADSMMNNQNGMEEDLLRKVEKAAREGAKEGAKHSGGGSGKVVTLFLLVIMLAVVGYVAVQAMKMKQNLDDIFHVEASANSHDLVLEDHGILGYTAADFQEAILGETKQQKKLEVYTAEISDAATFTDTGLANLSVFSKCQLITYHGTAIYTVDLSKLRTDDITLDEENHVITLKIPHAERGEITVPRGEIEYGDVDKGLLAFGDVEVPTEESNKVEAQAVEKMKEKLTELHQDEKADRFAKLSVWEVYQPIVKSVAKDYSLEVVFQDE